MELASASEAWKSYSEIVFTKMEEYLWDMQCENGQSAKECIDDTYAFAYKHLGHAMRKSGESYLDHAHRSVLLLLEVRPSLQTIQLCLLHDIPKMVEHWEKDVLKVFGQKSVVRLKKFWAIRKIHDFSDSNDDMEVLREMLLVLADDIEVIMVKLVTRLDSMTTVSSMPRSKQKKIATEVLYIFAPIASRMGMYGLKIRLEDEAFKLLWPKTYARVDAERTALIKKNSTLLDEAKEKLSKIMLTQGISGSIYHRIKNVYSIARKLQKKGFTHVAEIHDFFALRFILSTKEECYKLLGYIHEYFPPVPGRIKDYIALPKANRYMSLHTTVLGLYSRNPSRSVEIQLRTKDMDEIAEYGIASHVNYKDGIKEKAVVSWQNKLADFSRSFSETGQIDTLTEKNDKGFQDIFEKIYVLTPAGEIITLPKGATALDFAYSVHTDIGHGCVAAKVNGEVAALDAVLNSGDRVDITTRKGQKPSASFLLYVRTASARNKIRQYFRSLDHSQIERRGRELLQRYLVGQKSNLSSDAFLSLYIDKHKGKKSRSLLISEIGSGELLPKTMYRSVVGVKKKAPKVNKMRATANTRKLVIAGSPYMPFTVAGCCTGKIEELSGDDLIAYLNVRQEIRVHRKTCPHLGKDPKRMLQVAT